MLVNDLSHSTHEFNAIKLSENKNLLSKQTRIKTFKIPIHKTINVSGETLVEVSHAVRYIDSVGAVLKLQGILDVGILVNKSNEKI